MAKASRLQGHIDDVEAALERMSVRLPRLVECHASWKRGFAGGAGGSSGSGDTETKLTVPERAATTRQPDRDIETWARRLTKVSKMVLDLDKDMGRLLPLDDDVAAKLVDGDVGLCRAHLRADINVPLLRDDGARGELCRWCNDFRQGRDGRGGYGVDPTPAILKRRLEYGRVSTQFIDQELNRSSGAQGRKRRSGRKGA